MRLLNKNRGFRPIDCTHNARIDGSLYGQIVPSETIFLMINCALGHVMCARAWYIGFVRLS